MPAWSQVQHDTERYMEHVQAIIHANQHVSGMTYSEARETAQALANDTGVEQYVFMDGAGRCVVREAGKDTSGLLANGWRKRFIAEPLEDDDLDRHIQEGD